jgi:hypothetical protein
MCALVIFPYKKTIQVIPAKWVLNFDKKNIEKNQQSKVCYLQNEKEGLYKINIKVFGKFL